MPNLGAARQHCQYRLLARSVATVPDVPGSFHVYMQTVAPHPSWTAWKLRTKGVLTVGEREATFRCGSGEAILLTGVHRVGKGFRNQAYGQPLLPVVDTWIEVVYGSPDNPSVAFFNDSRWLGLGVYLPHRPLVRALQALLS